jgi:hypothetical protein
VLGERVFVCVDEASSRSFKVLLAEPRLGGVIDREVVELWVDMVLAALPFPSVATVFCGVYWCLLWEFVRRRKLPTLFNKPFGCVGVSGPGDDAEG